MSEDVLLLIMELFAVVGRNQNGHGAARRAMEEEFLRKTLNEEKAREFLALYDGHILSYQNDQEETIAKRKHRALTICEELNTALTQRQKAVVIVRLIEYVNIGEVKDSDELRFLEMVNGALRIKGEEFNLLYDFIVSDTKFQGENAMVVSSEPPSESNIKYLPAPNLDGVLRIVYVGSAEMYFVRYVGTTELYLNGLSINDHTAYIFSQGATIRGALVQPVYYSDVVNAFINKRIRQPVEYRVDDVTYRFPDGKIGLREVRLCERGGSLMGIMGGSGAGKSTLLSVLNGSARPSTGSVKINGLDLHREAQALEGVVGFVSQNDLLMEDLTVFQNLYFNAHLCFGGRDKSFITRKVIEVAKDLGLYEIRNLKVGSPLEKIISGGQRKRLNIALELIREPSVLFLDEPTSGLSSRDSEVIIDLLKTQALKGKLVFVVIHQPSSQIFKSFDKLLLLDQGGYPVYLGHPVDAVTYFKHATHHINPDVSECVCCGNVNPEQIFTILESRHLDDHGFPTGQRRCSAEQWNAHYKEHQLAPNPPASPHLTPLVNDYKKPGLIDQFKIFIQRDVLSKLNNRQYLFITVLEAPLLAFILAFLTRYEIPGKAYTFQDNRNLVAYIFMSVIVALFLGLMVSAEEIFRDRKIRERERFLNLSNAAYLKSKIIILMGISALQSLLFVAIGNSIIGFQEMYFEFWFMLFAVSLFANALGLNISSAFKSAVTIYIVIPFLIIPQLMLSGLLVKFNELNPALASRSVVPLTGEIMATRWAFEGLTVKLFKSNAFEKHLYEIEKEKAKAAYLKIPWYESVRDLITDVQKQPSDSALLLLETEFNKVGLDAQLANLEDVRSGSTLKHLEAARRRFMDAFSEAEEALDKKYKEDGGTGNAGVYWKELRTLHFNDRLDELVRNQDVLTQPVYEEYGELHSGQNSIYIDPPSSSFLRSHFYAPRKVIFGRYVDTYWVNVIVIFLMAIVLYVALYMDAFLKLMRLAERFLALIKK